MHGDGEERYKILMRKTERKRSFGDRMWTWFGRLYNDGSWRNSV
jgi:hypothetical protein